MLNSDVDLFEFQRKVADTVEFYYKRYCVNNLIGDAVTIYDSIITGDKEWVKNLKENPGYRGDDVLPSDSLHLLNLCLYDRVLYSTWEFGQKIESKPPATDPEKFGWVVLFKNKNNGEIYFMVEGEHEVEEAIKQYPEVTYFGYWDNSDRPDELSEEEWANRIASWEAALDLWSPVSGQGLVIRPLNRYTKIRDFKDVEQFIKKHGEMLNLPSLNERKRDILRRHAGEVLAKDVKNGVLDKEVFLSQFFSKMKEYMEKPEVLDAVAPKFELMDEFTLEDYALVVSSEFNKDK